MMGNLHLILVVLFVAGATQINGDEIKMPEGVPAPGLNVSQKYELINLVSLVPVDIIIEPRLVPMERAPSLNPNIAGRLLTPQEGCGVSGSGINRVVGGSPARNDAWPWMALLGYRRNGAFGGFLCAGSLITSRHVLSASHCMNNDLWFARFGEHDVRTDMDGPHVDIAIARWEQHQGWNPDIMVNDIAMLRLSQDIIFNERVKPVCLPFSSDLMHQRFVGHNPFVTGWGNTAEGGQQSPVLLQLQVPIVDNHQCREVFRQIGMLKADIQFSDMVICAGHIAGQSSCHGDSGGPLQLPFTVDGIRQHVYYQIGVVSWGIGCARPGIPSIYSNVQYFAQWIQSKLY